MESGQQRTPQHRVGLARPNGKKGVDASLEEVSLHKLSHIIKGGKKDSVKYRGRKGEKKQ